MIGRRPGPGVFRPVWITAVELSGPREDLVVPPAPQGVGHRYLEARVLVCLHGAPLGQLTVPLVQGRLTVARLDEAIRRDLAEELAAHLDADGLPGTPDPGTAISPAPASGCRRWGPAGDRPPVSVVVCTRDRPAEILRCLDALELLEYPDFEIVVVNNAPPDDSTARAIAAHDFARVRYVVAPRPGLSRARNFGVTQARSEIVAFTDDDVTVDRMWLEALVRGFARAPEVGCVTGLVPALELETRAQALFDRKMISASRFEPRLYDLARSRPSDPLFPFAAGEFGTGANFAIRRRAFDAIGGFDVHLGAGTPSAAGRTSTSSCA